MRTILFTLCYLLLTLPLPAEVTPGIEQLVQPPYIEWLKDKRVGLLTNQTGVTRDLVTSIEWLEKHQKRGYYRLTALFAPEHGLTGLQHAEQKVVHGLYQGKIPIYSLHGTHKRPTKEMLASIDILVFDIQDIGARSYTYINTLFFFMEEAAKQQIPVIVCDRPNPLGGLVVDGPMLDEDQRSIVGYLNVPYCHGMTAGELALFFNKQYNVGCQLRIVPMEGWRRWMTFHDTKLPWVPTSPHIPDADTPLYYPTTGILGEMQIVNIGVGYTLPFRVVGAPWIDADAFADELNKQKFPGVVFYPFHFTPFFGRFKKEACHGVLVVVRDATVYRPVSTQYLLIGILKSLYPKRMRDAMHASAHRRSMFAKINGSDRVWQLLENERYVVWKLRSLDEEKRLLFEQQRRPYLLYR